MPSPVNVFFIRGLSTYGHDNAKWSVFDFGPIHRHLSRALNERGLNIIPVLGMGSGPLPEVAARAKQFIVHHPAWAGPDPVHILGHSAGGLVARLVLHQLEQERPGKIASCLTVASPHKGAHLAQIMVEMPERYKGSHLFLRSLGYNVSSKREFFDDLLAPNVSRLLHGHSYQADTASIICWDQRSQWCTPLKLFLSVKAFRDFDLPSDGVVERDTQDFGAAAAELKIDHFRQVGLFGDGRRFEQMCDVIRDHFRSKN